MLLHKKYFLPGKKNLPGAGTPVQCKRIKQYHHQKHPRRQNQKHKDPKLDQKKEEE